MTLERFKGFEDLISCEGGLLAFSTLTLVALSWKGMKDNSMQFLPLDLSTLICSFFVLVTYVDGNLQTVHLL